MQNKAESARQQAIEDIAADNAEKGIDVTDFALEGDDTLDTVKVDVPEDLDLYNAASPRLTGGDVDAAWDQAAMVGDEGVGGLAPTPDQDIVDDLGKAVGIEMPDREPLHTDVVMETRDHRRWELDPQSAEDYPEH